MIIKLTEGQPFYGLLEDEGPEEGAFICELYGEEFDEAVKHGNRCISMAFYQPLAVQEERKS